MTSIQEAVRTGSLIHVQNLLKDGDPEALRTELPDALGIALDAGFSTIAHMLLDDARYEPVDQACSCLTKAITLGFPDIAEKLVLKGSKVNLIADNFRSPLRLALEEEYLDLARVMLANGAEISVRDEKGWTALIWASITGNRVVYDFLVENGADIHICTNDGWNALAAAFFKHHHEIASDLQARGAKFGPKHESAALVSSLLGGYHDVLRSLLDAGANPNLAFHEKNPLLSLAIIRGDKKTVELLIDKGADVNAASASGSSPLALAITLKHFDIAKMLISRVATVNVPDAVGNSPLHLAAMHGSDTLCKLLVEHGASVNAADNDGYTPLIRASRNGHPIAVETLIGCGADINAQTPVGRSALWLTQVVNPKTDGVMQALVVLEANGAV